MLTPCPAIGSKPQETRGADQQLPGGRPDDQALAGVLGYQPRLQVMGPKPHRWITLKHSMVATESCFGTKFEATGPF